MYCLLLFFFFNDTATTEIYTLSLHDALPILRRTPRARPSRCSRCVEARGRRPDSRSRPCPAHSAPARRPPAPHRSLHLPARSEEHTSELQSRQYLVCRLLLEKKKKTLVTSTE